MYAAIPAPREVYASSTLGNEAEVWALTNDSGLIANAGPAAVLAADEAKVLGALNTLAEVPEGFTHYRALDVSHYLNDEQKRQPLGKLLDRLNTAERRTYGSDSYRNVRLIVKTPALVADDSVGRVGILSQARVTPEGVLIDDAQMKMLVSAASLDHATNTTAVEYRTKWSNGRNSVDKDNWSIKRTIVIDDKYLITPMPDDKYRLSYSPTRVASLRTRRKNNVGKDRKPRLTAFQSLTGIINAFSVHAWDWSGLTWSLATRNYRTYSLTSCADTIVAYTKFATKIGRMDACRKAYKPFVQAAWYHRGLLTKNVPEAFMRWYWRELKLAGKPADAVEFERAQREKLKRKRNRAAQAERYLAKVEQFKGQI